VLVNFWATWCPPCRKAMPDLQALHDQYKDQGFLVLSISDEEMARGSPFIAERKITYPVLLDPGRKVNDAFVVEGIPQSFVYDREGRMVDQSIDMGARSQFQQMLAPSRPTLIVCVSKVDTSKPVKRQPLQLLETIRIRASLQPCPSPSLHWDRF